MIFPFESLTGNGREIGLVVGVLIGFCFGFVLERAGFGRSTKLAAQFYLYDMTVFKVMFSAIVTAMLGVVIAAGLGLVDIRQLSQMAVSETFIWPMLVGGLLLGAGFIISGFCPGTSIVAAGTGAIDGIVVFLGVTIGSVVYGMVQPSIAGFHVSGAYGQVFLYDLLGVSPAVVAIVVAVVAIACFLGAEKVERLVTEKYFHRAYDPAPSPSRRFAFVTFVAAGALGVALLFVPVGTQASAAADAANSAPTMSVDELCHRWLDAPWQLRVIDLRPEDAFVAKRIPGSENVAGDELAKLGLQYSAGVQDVVLVGANDLTAVPPAALQYPGHVYLLKDGFTAWQRFVLDKPAPPPADAPDAQFERYQFQSAVHAAVTGVKAPPPPKKSTKFVAPPKRKAGGCS